MQASETAIIGHRGAMGRAPENTMASFQKGVDLGADLIELDVHLSKDGELVVMHDPTVDRTTNGKGWIKDLTLKEIRMLDAGVRFDPRFAGQKVPTLEEVLHWARGRTRLLIEIKNGPVYYERIEESVAAAVRLHRMVDSCAVISFDHYSVKRLKALSTDIRTGVLYACRPVDPLHLARTSGAQILMPNRAYATPDLVDAAHQAGLAVYVWTVNDPSEMECVAGLHVDAIGTNYPDRLRAYLRPS
ncbi:MAG: glycerophosphodiester phosphodiesterase [Chloroflexi bacterium]|nr:glycerophosphodiester phosphodiesterase [Chloroflexota bacterium]